MSSDDTSLDGLGREATAPEPLLAFADTCASAAGQSQPLDPIVQLVTFTVRDEEIGVPIEACREIASVGAITRVPEAPPLIRGVVHVRGRILPVVDARSCLGLGATMPTAKSRLLVVELRGRLLGLLVDRVARIVKVPASAIQMPNRAGPAGPSYWRGSATVDGRTVSVVDLERLLLAGPPDLGRPKE